MTDRELIEQGRRLAKKLSAAQKQVDITERVFVPDLTAGALGAQLDELADALQQALERVSALERQRKHPHTNPSPSHEPGAWCQGGCGAFVPLGHYQDAPHESYLQDVRGHHRCERAEAAEQQVSALEDGIEKQRAMLETAEKEQDELRAEAIDSAEELVAAEASLARLTTQHERLRSALELIVNSHYLTDHQKMAHAALIIEEDSKT